MKDDDTVSELTEEMELVGPGSMLAEARKSMGLSQQEVAEKLNFRTTLVIDMEAERFDKKLPETFNRGYLRNYAKLVDISVDEVLTSYEVLHVAEKQGAEMLSFSRGTSIKAENKRIMWASYFILAALITSTVVWWVQDNDVVEVQLTPDISNNSDLTEINVQVIRQEQTPLSQENEAVLPDEVAIEESENFNKIESETSEGITALPSSNSESSITESTLELDATVQVEDDSVVNNAESFEIAEAEFAEPELEEKVLITTPPVDVQFTFLGDCWVDIYDANGEHIAWGVKKEGYVMNISAIPPIAITLGKPELVSITFEDTEVNMNKYSKGNIAKFTLPLAP